VCTWWLSQSTTWTVGHHDSKECVQFKYCTAFSRSQGSSRQLDATIVSTCCTPPSSVSPQPLLLSLISSNKQLLRHFCSMVFVYTGAGKFGSKHLSEAESFCVKEACLIQKCIANNGSSQQKCKAVIEFWQACVDRHGTRLQLKEEREAGGGEKPRYR
jgi:hypothetical protein